MKLLRMRSRSSGWKNRLKATKRIKLEWLFVSLIYGKGPIIYYKQAIFFYFRTFILISACCFYCFIVFYRRILAIEANAQWSTAGELQQHRLIHDRYIIQLRVSISLGHYDPQNIFTHYKHIFFVCSAAVECDSWCVQWHLTRIS